MAASMSKLGFAVTDTLQVVMERTKAGFWMGSSEFNVKDTPFMYITSVIDLWELESESAVVCLFELGPKLFGLIIVIDNPLCSMILELHLISAHKLGRTPRGGWAKPYIEALVDNYSKGIIASFVRYGINDEWTSCPSPVGLVKIKTKSK
jgi:hypothetical protein